MAFAPRLIMRAGNDPSAKTATGSRSRRMRSHRLDELFEAEPDRLARLTLDVAGIHFDWSKTHLDAALLDRVRRAGRSAAGSPRARDALFAGEIVNPTEGRAAEHVAERGQGAPERRPRRRPPRADARADRRDRGRGVRRRSASILHIGIGGSALGPELLVDALGRDAGRYDVSVSCPTSTARRSRRRSTGFDPAHDPGRRSRPRPSPPPRRCSTLARRSTGWSEGGVDDPYGRVIALTAEPASGDRVRGRRDPHPAVRRERRRALFAVVVGRLSGRAGARLGRVRGAARRRGGDGPPFPPAPSRAPTRRCSPPSPTCYYARSCGCQTRAVFAYDERLRLLPSYLQQLEMESNGKSRDARRHAGRPRRPRRSPGAGSAPTPSMRCSSCSTRARISSRSSSSPSIEPGDGLRPGASPPAAAQLLRPGRGADGRARRATIRTAPIPATGRRRRSCSTGSIRATLGALIAFYEHRTFANAVLLGINPFDQFGVELGKEMARAIDDPESRERFDASTRALIERAGV